MSSMLLAFAKIYNIWGAGNNGRLRGEAPGVCVATGHLLRSLVGPSCDDKWGCARLGLKDYPIQIRSLAHLSLLTSALGSKQRAPRRGEDGMCVPHTMFFRGRLLLGATAYPAVSNVSLCACLNLDTCVELEVDPGSVRLPRSCLPHCPWEDLRSDLDFDGEVVPVYAGIQSYRSLCCGQTTRATFSRMEDASRHLVPTITCVRIPSAASITQYKFAEPTLCRSLPRGGSGKGPESEAQNTLTEPCYIPNGLFPKINDNLPHPP